MSLSPSLKRRLLITGVVVALLLVGAGALFAGSTWGEVNRVSIERPDANPHLGALMDKGEDPSMDSETGDELDPTDTGLQIILLVGSDSRSDLEDTEGFGDFEGNRADVVMVLFKNGANTGLLSLPRDLMVDDPCRDREERLSEMLQGCPRMNGATLLTVAVERLIDRSIDHFALVDLAGFQAAVNAVGGYEVCVERPVRDRRANLSLPAGCTLADGDQTLAWLRSRRTQELTANGWRTVPGVNDLVRNERQRAFLIDMMSQVSDFSSAQDVAQAAQAVAPFVTVDAELSLMDAVNIAYTMRGLRSGAVVELSVPVYDDRTSGGAAVLRPSTPVHEIVTEFLSTTAADNATILGLGH
jgi:LCP family protein required for cell wall assembly